MRPLRIGTRGSALALAQTRLVAEALAAADPDAQVEMVAIRTSGDERTADRPSGERRTAGPPSPAAPGDKSRFVKEIEEALLTGEIDLAVHSAKDVPGTLPDGLAIVAVPERADARDALCGAASLAELPAGGLVGTSSLRRRSQLLAGRPDLAVQELRGNVDTRLRRLREGAYTAIVVAAAGLVRLGRPASSLLPLDQLTPAPGQGCLALEARAADAPVAALAGRLTDRESLIRLTAERALVDSLGASCRTPIGAHAALDDRGLTLAAFVGLPDGSTWIRDSVAGHADEPSALGRLLGDRLAAAGAEDLLAAAEIWEADRAAHRD